TAVNAKPSLNKIVFVHRQDNFVKPDNLGKPPKDDASDAYELLGKNVKWQETGLTFVINPSNDDGLLSTFVENTIVASTAEWDKYTSADLFASYTVDEDAVIDGDEPDGSNEIVFGNIEDGGVIAVCVIWGFFLGPPSTRKIVEFDIMFDDFDYAWGDATENPALMDLQNIATHELGHGLGLADLYDLNLQEQTMYGYADFGETNKRDLASGDIAGIQFLYGK
ncbi:MAG: matrixin family metalloprotease, partial [Candidatus Bathyarchaeota archaeon]|nr:matrixin family metalloprotease [Candidatus Bathyarchaeota archaeon]